MKGLNSFELQGPLTIFKRNLGGNPKVLITPTTIFVLNSNFFNLVFT